LEAQAGLPDWTAPEASSLRWPGAGDKPSGTRAECKLRVDAAFRDFATKAKEGGLGELTAALTNLLGSFMEEAAWLCVGKPKPAARRSKNGGVIIKARN